LNDGEWNLELIANEWDIDTAEWGIIEWIEDNQEDNEPTPVEPQPNYSITLDFDDVTYEIVKTELLKNGQTYEDAVCNLLDIKTID
jgi:hypothetical protein